MEVEAKGSSGEAVDTSPREDGEGVDAMDTSTASPSASSPSTGKDEGNDEVHDGGNVVKSEPETDEVKAEGGGGDVVDGEGEDVTEADTFAADFVPTSTTLMAGTYSSHAVQNDLNSSFCIFVILVQIMWD